MPLPWNKLPLDDLIVVLANANNTLQLETEGLNLPAMGFALAEKEMFAIEAYFLGLLEGYVLGALKTRGHITYFGGRNLKLKGRAAKMFEDAMFGVSRKGYCWDQSAALYWLTLYRGSSFFDMVEGKEKHEEFSRRLYRSKRLEIGAYQIGKEDAFCQMGRSKSDLMKRTGAMSEYIMGKRKDSPLPD